MKVITKILSLFVVAGLATFYMSCGKDDGNKKTEEQLKLEQLSKTWTLQSATLNDADKTSTFPNLKLTLSGTFAGPGGTYNYSYTGTRPEPSPTPANGTWKFGSSVGSQIIRDPETDNFPMNYSLANNQLTIEFTCTSCDYPGGTTRTSSVNGNWVFIFN